MLRLRGGLLVWGERHYGQMQHIVGAEAAVTGHAPVLPSIVKLAKTRGIPLDRSARQLLAQEEEIRVEAKHLKRLEDVEPRNALEASGFTHQRVALNLFRTLDYPGILCTDKTGVGKTWQAIMWARRRRRKLVVTKNIAKEQWADAIHRYVGADQRIIMVEGTIPRQIELSSRDRRAWTIAHWESLSNAGKGYLKRPWDAIILDEAHYIANRNAQRSGVAHRLKGELRMAMTAHPYSNDPGELFSLLRFLYPKTYRSYWRFFHMHVKATPKQWGGFDVEGPRRPALLRWEIAPYTIGRSKQQVFKSLPEITRTKRVVSLTVRGEREYARLRKELFAELDGLDGGRKVVPIINDLSRLTRVRQYLVDPALIGGAEKSVKYPAIWEIMDEVNDPIVVFTEFKQAGLRLAQFLRKQKRKLRIAHIHGGMQKQVEGIKKKFLHGDLDIIIAVSKAANEAVNLGKYGYVAHLDLPWTPRELEQAEGRVDRPEEHTGNLVPTTAYRVIVKDSYEERMQHKLIKKHGNFAKVFTITDLRELFT